jgi:acyl-CoA thioester hydrolase
MTDPVPAAGEMRGKTHVFPIRVYYEDTDAGGVVYHANYLRFTERARTEMLRAAGIAQGELAAGHGLMFVVHTSDVRFLKPARLDDALVVETTLRSVGAASVGLDPTIRRSQASDGADLVKFSANVACIDRAGRPARMPTDLKAKLMNYVTA